LTTAHNRPGTAHNRPGTASNHPKTASFDAGTTWFHTRENREIHWFSAGKRRRLKTNEAQGAFRLCSRTLANSTMGYVSKKTNQNRYDRKNRFENVSLR
jgi:hypothetical protein